MKDHPYIIRHPTLKVDLLQLQQWYFDVVRKYPITLQGGEYGGWSVTSADGSLSEGWQTGQRAFGKIAGKVTVDHALNAQLFSKGFDHRRPTPIYTSEIRELYALLAEHKILGLNRTRVHKLPPLYNAEWHVDSEDERWRIHVPLLTNPKCRMHYEVDDAVVNTHMPADGSVYFVRVDKRHAISNSSPHARIHLIAQLPPTFRPGAII